MCLRTQDGRAVYLNEAYPMDVAAMLWMWLAEVPERVSGDVGRLRDHKLVVTEAWTRKLDEEWHW